MEDVRRQTFPQVESALYRMGQPFVGRPSVASPSLTPRPPARVFVDDISPAMERRLDLHFAIGRLTADDAVLIRDVYILGVQRHPRGDVRRAVRRLRDLLAEDDL